LLSFGFVDAKLQHHVGYFQTFLNNQKILLSLQPQSEIKRHKTASTGDFAEKNY